LTWLLSFDGISESCSCSIDEYALEAVYCMISSFELFI